jgi:hypothetical protein
LSILFPRQKSVQPYYCLSDQLPPPVERTYDGDAANDFTENTGLLEHFTPTLKLPPAALPAECADGFKLTTLTFYTTQLTLPYPIYGPALPSLTPVYSGLPWPPISHPTHRA